MKSKSLIALAISFCLAIPIAAQAADYNWWLLESGTEIFGWLHKITPKTYEALTENQSTQKGTGVYVQAYAKSSGNICPGSVSVVKNYSNSATTRTTADNPETWGSGHSTMAIEDRYEWLYISIR